jgi:ABC-2 type transport system permease protein
VIREFSRILRIWGQTIVPPAITATLYFIIFGSLIGRRIGDMGGFSYMQYIAPGLIMMSVITNSYGNVVSSFFGAKFGRHLEELLVAPLPNWLIVLGLHHRRRGARVAGRAARHDHRAVLHPPARRAPARSVIGRGAAYVDGVLAARVHQRGVREELRPDHLRAHVHPDADDVPRRCVLLDHDAARVGAIRVSKANPILYMVNAFRYGFLGLSDVEPPRISFLFMTAQPLAALFVPCASG